MSRRAKFGGVAIATIAALGMGVSSASAAYTITDNNGGTFTGTNAAGNQQYFEIDGGAATICNTASFTGTASSPATDNVNFAPSFGGCTFVGQAATVGVTGSWNVKVTGNSGTTYTGQVSLNSGSVATINALSGACTVQVKGVQTFVNGVSGNVGTAVNTGSGGTAKAKLTAIANNIARTDNGGCGLTSSTGSLTGTPIADGIYDTQGTIDIPNIVVAGP